MVLFICSGAQNENCIQVCFFFAKDTNCIQVCDITSEICTSTLSFRDEVEAHEQI